MTGCGKCYKRPYVKSTDDSCKDDCKKCGPKCDDKCKKCKPTCEDDCKKCDRNCKDDCKSCKKPESSSSEDHFDESSSSSYDESTSSEHSESSEDQGCGCCCWYYHAGKEYKCVHIKSGKEKGCKNKIGKRRQVSKKSGCDNDCDGSCPQRAFCEDECKPKPQSCDPCCKPKKRCVNVTVSRSCNEYTNNYFKNCEIKLEKPKKCVRYVKTSEHREVCKKC